MGKEIIMETCLDCGEDFSMGELVENLCDDCRSRFDDMDLEDQFEKAMEL